MSIIIAPVASAEEAGEEGGGEEGADHLIKILVVCKYLKLF